MRKNHCSQYCGIYEIYFLLLRTATLYLIMRPMAEVTNRPHLLLFVCLLVESPHHVFLGQTAKLKRFLQAAGGGVLAMPSVFCVTLWWYWGSHADGGRKENSPHHPVLLWLRDPSGWMNSKHRAGSHVDAGEGQGTCMLWLYLCIRPWRCRMGWPTTWVPRSQNSLPCQYLFFCSLNLNQDKWNSKMLTFKKGIIKHFFPIFKSSWKILVLLLKC